MGENLVESIFPYIDNDPLVKITLKNRSSGKEKEVLAYVDTGSDSIAVPKDVWDNLNIETYRATTISVVGGAITTWYTKLDVEFHDKLHKNVIVFYQEFGDVLLGRSVTDKYVITFDGLNSTLTVSNNKTNVYLCVDRLKKNIHFNTFPIIITHYALNHRPDPRSCGNKQS